MPAASETKRLQYSPYLKIKSMNGQRLLPAIAKLIATMQLPQWSSNAPPAASVPLIINWSETQLDWLPEKWPALPAHISIRVGALEQ